jgi:hypothetical protein
MTLTTHALVGVTAAQFFPQEPVLAFAAAFLSHLAIDSLPHYDYQIFSLLKDKSRPLETDMKVKITRAFVLDVLRIGSDILIGLSLCFLIFGFLFHLASPLTILLGAIGGISPDPLQFVYWKTRSKILLPLQRFHVWVQKGKELDVHPLIGLGLQAFLLIALIAGSLYIRGGTKI